MMGRFLNFDELMRRLDEREMRRRELLEWYKKRIELLSKRAK